MLLVEPMFLLEQEIEKEVVVRLAQWNPGNCLEGELYERGGSQL